MTAAGALPEGRRDLRGKWLLPICGAVLTALVAVALAIETSRLTMTPTKIAQEYADAAHEGDWARAWDLMCAASQEYEGQQQEFVAAREGHALLERQIAGSYAPVRSAAIEAWKVDVRIEGSASRVEWIVVREDGSLRVCHAGRYLIEQGVLSFP